MKFLIIVINICFLMACNAQSPETKLSYADMLRKEFPQLATDLTNQGIAFSEAQKMTEAEAAFKQAIVLRRQLTDANPVGEKYLLAQSLNNLGFCYQTMQQFDKALIPFKESMEITTLDLIQNKVGATMQGNLVFQSFKNTMDNLGNMQEEAATKKDTATLIATARLMALNADIIVVVTEKYRPLAVYQYANVAWMVLLQKDLKAAEKAARRALELDETQTFVKVALAHALLFQNKYEEAEQLYLALKPLNNAENDRSYHDIFLEDFETLKRYGLTHKNVQRIVQRLNQ